MVLATIVEIMILTTFGNHFYRWEGENRQQMDGAAMGVRASGALARITMDVWMKEFRKKLNIIKMKLRLGKK